MCLKICTGENFFTLKKATLKEVGLEHEKFVVSFEMVQFVYLCIAVVTGTKAWDRCVVVF